MTKRLMTAALALVLAGCATLQAMADSPYVSGTLDANGEAVRLHAGLSMADVKGLDCVAGVERMKAVCWGEDTAEGLVVRIYGLSGQSYGYRVNLKAGRLEPSLP